MTLSVSKLKKVEIPLPPLAEQRRIVAALEDHLSRLEAGTRSLHGIVEKMQALRNSVFDHALRTFEASQVRFADVLEMPLANGRSVQTRPGGFPVLRLTALKGRHADLSEWKEGDWEAADAERYLVAKGDFLISRGNGSLDLLARGSLVADEPFPVAFPDTIIRARPNISVLNPRYLALVWSSGIVRRQVKSIARTTAGIYKVNQKSLGDLMIPLPSVRAQQEIVRAVSDKEASLAKLDAAQEYARMRADHLRRSLLREAFAGRLVAQDPADEPASVLLERIRAERESVPKTRRGRKARAVKTAPAPAIDPTRPLPEAVGRGTQGALDLGL
ncbi:hypothetical protein GCM10009545_22160 [Saccharopolyspora thermophila]|uniref:Type I restriction modification DNA specificity domain-containing protein n=2 Tax=Saccharopolyspora thermophila TaxID=89367 RepID=A0ABP3MJP7_9PSEU